MLCLRNNLSVTEVQCTLRRGELAVCTNTRTRVSVYR